jgi:large subunit ribosomal protein L18
MRRKVLPLKRRREGKTNYRKRLALLKSGKPRVVIRKSNKYITLQLVEFDLKNFKEITKFSFISKKLENFGWNYSKNNLPASYLAGLAFGLICKKNKVKEGVLDIGLNRVTKGNRIFSALLGCVDAGLKIPYSDKNLPSEERVKGAHISEDVVKKFEEVKQKILDYYGRE